jgi:hypothetical protein
MKDVRERQLVYALIGLIVPGSRSSCQAPAMPNGRCRMHGGSSPGAPKGNKNALKHGRYSAEAGGPLRWQQARGGLQARAVAVKYVLLDDLIVRLSADCPWRVRRTLSVSTSGRKS